MVDKAFPIRKHNQHHLDLWPTHPCYFWSRGPSPNPLRRLNIGFNSIPKIARLISCYDILKKVFITISLASSSWLIFHGSLSDRQSTKSGTSFELTRRVWSFSVTNLMASPMMTPISSATSRTVKHRFRRITVRELCRHGRRLLMRKAAQAWDLHRPPFCPL